MLVRIIDYRPSRPPNGSMGWSEEMEEHQGCVINVTIEERPPYQGEGYYKWMSPSGSIWHFQKEWVVIAEEDKEYLNILENL